MIFSPKKLLVFLSVSMLLNFALLAASFSQGNQNIVTSTYTIPTAHLILNSPISCFQQEIIKAVAEGNEDLLMRLCASYKINLSHFDLSGLHEILYNTAIQNNKPEMILALMKLNAFISKSSLTNIINFAKHKLSSNSFDSFFDGLRNYRDEQHNSLLHQAVMYQDVNSIQLILNLFPCMINAKNKDEHRPVDLILLLNNSLCDSIRYDRQTKEIIISMLTNSANISRLIEPPSVNTPEDFQLLVPNPDQNNQNINPPPQIFFDNETIGSERGGVLDYVPHGPDNQHVNQREEMLFLESPMEEEMDDYPDYFSSMPPERMERNSGFSL